MIERKKVQRAQGTSEGSLEVQRTMKMHWLHKGSWQVDNQQFRKEDLRLRSVVGIVHNWIMQIWGSNRINLTE